GVVTSIRIRLHPVPDMLAGLILFPWAQAETVFRGYEALLSASAPDALSITASIVSGPDGQPVVRISPVWSGDAADGWTMIRRIRDWGTPVLDQVERMTAAGQTHLPDEVIVDARRRAIKTWWLPGLSTRVISALVAAGSAVTSPGSGIILHHFH